MTSDQFVERFLIPTFDADDAIVTVDTVSLPMVKNHDQSVWSIETDDGTQFTVSVDRAVA